MRGKEVTAIFFSPELSPLLAPTEKVKLELDPYECFLTMDCPQEVKTLH